jgi:hypothetical protein
MCSVPAVGSARSAAGDEGQTAIRPAKTTAAPILPGVSITVDDHRTVCRVDDSPI